MYVTLTPQYIQHLSFPFTREVMKTRLFKSSADDTDDTLTLFSAHVEISLIKVSQKLNLSVSTVEQVSGKEVSVSFSFLK